VSLFTGVYFDLFHDFQHLVGQAQVSDREIHCDKCDHQQTANNPFHRSLPVIAGILASFSSDGI
jgi:hypothetical protein